MTKGDLSTVGALEKSVSGPLGNVANMVYIACNTDVEFLLARGPGRLPYSPLLKTSSAYKFLAILLLILCCNLIIYAKF